MSLQERIRAAVLDGRLEDALTTSDLVANASLFEGFGIANLRTQPPNCSVSMPGLDLGTGANVVNEAQAPFLRVGMRGRAILYSVRSRSGDQTVTGPNTAKEALPGPEPDNTTVEAIVESDRTVDEEAGSSAAYLLGNDAREALRLLVRQIQQEESWDERLRNYVWKGRTFVETQGELADVIWQGSVLSRFIERDIAWNTQDEIQAVVWATRIFSWGGTRQKSPVTWQKVRHTLTNAVFNRVEHRAAPMNSGYTKVASFGTAYLDGETGRAPQVINDSRVATSLTWRLEKILQEHGWLPANLFPGLGKVEAARGGTRPRPLVMDWLDAYQRWSGQFAATAVVLAMKDILNQNDSFPKMPFGEQEMPWTVRGVEAVLFMDGY